MKTAALALCAGIASTALTPAAQAGVAPYTLWNTKEKQYTSQAEVAAQNPGALSTITKHDIEATMLGTDGTNGGNGYFKRDANGQLLHDSNGLLIPNTPEKFNWLINVYNNHRADKKVQYWTATSPAMDGREVNLAVITPTGNFDQSRPTIYLLNGAGGADQGMDWIVETAGGPAQENVVDFYLRKNVNVVIVQDGAFSYYTDWLSTPNAGYLEGKQKWETFLTKELPGVIESPENLNSNGKRAIAGMSMSATSSLLLAEHNPGFYDAVGSYSGCAATTTPMPRMYAELTVGRGSGTVDQMWGSANGQYAIYNDALINSNNLKGTKLYVSTSTGVPGETEIGATASGGSAPGILAISTKLLGSSTGLLEGSTIESAMNDCTHQLQNKLQAEGIDATFNFRPTGIHSWPGWREDNWKSWDTYAAAFGQPTGLEVDPAIGTNAP